MALYRDKLKQWRCLSSRNLERCPAGRIVQVAGLVLVRQAPLTSKGFQFVTLEDEFGMINVIVRPAVYEQQRHIIRSTTLLMVQEEIQHERGVVNIVAQVFKPLPSSSSES